MLLGDAWDGRSVAHPREENVMPSYNQECGLINRAVLSVISTDKKLYRLCSEIVNDYLGNRWDVVTSDYSTIMPGAALYILDFTPNMALPSTMKPGNGSRYLLLVDESDLAEFR